MLSDISVKCFLGILLTFFSVFSNSSELEAQNGDGIPPCLKQIEYAIYQSLQCIPTSVTNSYPEPVKYEIVYKLLVADKEEESTIKLRLKSFKGIDEDHAKNYAFYDKLDKIVNRPEIKECLLNLALPSIRIGLTNTNTIGKVSSEVPGYKTEEQIIDILFVCTFQEIKN